MPAKCGRPQKGSKNPDGEELTESQELTNDIEGISLISPMGEEEMVQPRITRTTSKKSEPVMEELKLDITGMEGTPTKIGIQFIMQKQNDDVFVAQKHIAIYDAGNKKQTTAVKKHMEDAIKKGKSQDANFTF